MAQEELANGGQLNPERQAVYEELKRKQPHFSRLNRLALEESKRQGKPHPLA